MNKEIHKHLFKYGGVIAVGTGHKIRSGKTEPGICVTVGVLRKLPLSKLKSTDIIPKNIDNFITDVIEVGKIKVRENTQRERPARGGISVGHFEITAGTLAAWVKKGRNPYILSNNHVLANSNSGVIGDHILQPGSYDGGTITNDIIAKLSEFVPIVFGGGGEPPSDCKVSKLITSILNGIATVIRSKTRLKSYIRATDVNVVDAAIAEAINPEWAISEIKDIGTVNGIVQGQLDMAVKKSGRTTGLTQGTIMMVDSTVQVDYGGPIATFEDQLIISPGGFSAGGDSGSLVLNTQNNAVGLLFAGSDTVTIVNRIQNVFALLQIEDFF